AGAGAGMDQRRDEGRRTCGHRRARRIPRQDGAACAAGSLCDRHPDGDGDRAARLAHRCDQADGERGGAGRAEEPRPDGSWCAGGARPHPCQCRRLKRAQMRWTRMLSAARAAAREGDVKGEASMRTRRLRHAVLGLGLIAIVVVPSLVGAADPDWKAVEQALGKAGQLQPGDVFRIGMPRTDLAVTVKGVPVKAPFALGSYAAFKQVGDHAMVMGDLVLLDQEIPGVMSGLMAGGLDVTAVHNHLNEMSPHVMYMHYAGHGEAVQLAKVLRQALSASATPLGASGGAAASAGSTLDTKQIEQALG